MGEIDDRTIDGLKATPVRAFEQGDAAVREFFAKRFAAGSDGGEPETVRRDEYADVAVEEGRYGRRSGDTLLDSGKYIAVFRRQPDGAWRWSTDMWNSDAG
jgi:ketosteroid isomerase-like protein